MKKTVIDPHGKRGGRHTNNSIMTKSASFTKEKIQIKL